MSDKPKRGRPPTGKKVRDAEVFFSLTEEDAEFCSRVARDAGFKSRSQMITAIVERLCIGGFSGMAFVKIGFQFSNVLSTKKTQGGLFFGVRPFPPLIGDDDDPSGPDIVPFAEGIIKQAAKEKAA